MPNPLSKHQIGTGVCTQRRHLELVPYDSASKVRIVDVTVSPVNVFLSLDRNGAFADGGFDGIIGGAFLRRFHKIIVDFPNRRLLLSSPTEPSDVAR
jgi:hypothetical protein